MRTLEVRYFVVFFVCLSAPVASADPIAIVNAGFEEPVQSPGAFTIGVDPPGWTFVGTTRRAVWNVSNNPFGWFQFGAPEGNQIGALWEGSFVQTLGVVLAPITTYTLQAEYMHVPGFVSEFTLERLAGGVSLGSTGGLLPLLLDGTFYPAEVVVATNATPAHQGESLVIRISSTAAEAEFDNIRLDASSLGAELVSIDIKPGSDPNCFNINGNGVIPVAILGSDTFDVLNIDTSILFFAGLEVRVRGKKGPLCHSEDSNGDAFLDLVCQFEDDTSMWSPDSSAEATLSGTANGTEFEGTDSICVTQEVEAQCPDGQLPPCE